MRALALGLACVAVLVACNPKPPPEHSPTPSANPNATPTGVSLKITGNAPGESRRVRFVALSKGNRKDYDMLVKSFQSVGASGNAHLSFEQPHITFFARDGSRLVATSPHATADQTANIVIMDGGVNARSSAGTTLQCDTLTYDRTTQMLHGTGNVVITNRDGFRGTGNRVDSNVSLTRTTMR